MQKSSLHLAVLQLLSSPAWAVGGTAVLQWKDKHTTNLYAGRILEIPGFSVGIYDGPVKMFVPQQAPQDALVLHSWALSEGERRYLLCVDSWVFQPLCN